MLFRFLCIIDCYWYFYLMVRIPNTHRYRKPVVRVSRFVADLSKTNRKELADFTVLLSEDYRSFNTSVEIRYTMVSIPSSPLHTRFLLRCPKFLVRYLLTKFRPLPLAHLASSAAGSARITPHRTSAFYCSNPDIREIKKPEQ